MKRFFIVALALLLFGAAVYGAITYDQTYYRNNRGYLNSAGLNDPVYNFIGEAEGYLEGTTAFPYLKLTSTDTEPGTTEGMMYWDTSEHALKVRTNSAWTAIGSGTFTGGNIASDVTLNADGVDIQGTTTTAHQFQIKGYDVDNTTYRALFDWTNGNTIALIVGDALASLAVQSTGLNVTTAGAVSGVTTLAMGGALTGVTTINATGAVTADSLVMPNGGAVSNSVDTEIKLAEASEDLIFDMDAGSNVVGLKTSTGLTGLAMGTVDDLSGVGSITFDAAAATITTATDGAAQDLTLSITGATDSSIVISSTGTAADALQITTSAGGIDITSAGTAGEDIDITASAGSINIKANENDTAAIVISTAGGGGTSEGIDIANDQGTAEDSIDLASTAGGIDIDAAAGKDLALGGGQVAIASTDDAASAISLTANTGTSETIVVTNTQGTAEGAITLTSTAGGVDIDAAAAKNVAIDGGQVLIASKDNAASAIALTANVGTTETIVVTNTQGTATGAVTLTATAGGVDIDAAATKDVAIDGGQVILTSKDNAASAISLVTNIGTTETITATNTQGTDAGAIGLTASAGGITLSAATAGKGITLTGEVYVKKGGDIASPAGGELDLTNGVYFDITGTNNVTSIAAADSIAGRLIVLQFDAILTFTDGNNLKLAGNFVTSADDTITLICDGTNWHEIARSAN